MRGLNFKKSLLGGAAALAAGVSGQAAVAQDGGQEESARVRDEIIVTSRFRKESLQDVGQSIGVLSSDAIEQLAVTDASDIARLTPGLDVVDYGPGQNDFRIRGIARLVSITDQHFVSNNVGVFFDDAPVNSLFSAQAEIRAFDLERVEVLRGPQPTYYGESSQGGAVRYISKNPSLTEFEGVAEVEATNVKGGELAFGGRGAVSIPIVEDRFGIRAVFNRSARGGFIDQVTSAGVVKDVNDFHQTGARIVALAQITPELTARAVYSRDWLSVGAENVISGADKNSDIVRLDVASDDGSDVFNIGNFRLDYDTGPVKITALMSYFGRNTDIERAEPEATQYSNVLSLNPYYFGADTFFSTGRGARQLDIDVYAPELRIATDFDGPINFVGGAFFRHLDQSYAYQNTSEVGLLAPSLNDTRLSVGETIVASDQYAVYGEAQIRLSDRLRLIGGGRWFSESIDRTNSSGPGGVLVVVNGVDLSDLLGLVFDPQVTSASLSTKLSKFLPKASIEFDVTDDILAYASYSQGAKSGGINSPVTGEIANILIGEEAAKELLSFGPEEVDSYEAGLKAEFLDGALIVNTGFYYMDWTNLQVEFFFADAFGAIVNANDARTIGGELEFNYQFNEHFQLFGGFNYTNAETTSGFVPANGSGYVPKGASVAFVPKYTWSLGANVRHPTPFSQDVDWYAGADVQYNEGGVRSLAVAERVGSQYLLGARIGLESVDGWGLELRGANLLDERVIYLTEQWDPALIYLGYDLGDNTINRSRVTTPRTVSLVLRRSF